MWDQANGLSRSLCWICAPYDLSPKSSHWRAHTAVVWTHAQHKMSSTSWATDTDIFLRSWRTKPKLKGQWILDLNSAVSEKGQRGCSKWYWPEKVFLVAIIVGLIWPEMQTVVSQFKRSEEWLLMVWKWFSKINNQCDQMMMKCSFKWDGKGGIPGYWQHWVYERHRASSFQC